MLSEDGRLPGTDVGSHLGPGRYAVDNVSIASRKKGASFGGFGSAARNLVPIKEGPGPGRFQRNQFDFKKKKNGKQPKPSSVFRNKQDRFTRQRTDADDLGPGHYMPKPSPFDKRKERKPAAPATTVRVVHQPSVPSVPRINQSFGYDETEDGKLKLHQPPRSTYGGAKLGNPNDPNDRTSWISSQLRDTVGPAYYDRPNDSSFAAAMSRRSRPGKTVSSGCQFFPVVGCVCCALPCLPAAFAQSHACSRSSVHASSCGFVGCAVGVQRHLPLRAFFVFNRSLSQCLSLIHI